MVSSSHRIYPWIRGKGPQIHRNKQKTLIIIFEFYSQNHFRIASIFDMKIDMGESKTGKQDIDPVQ